MVAGPALVESKNTFLHVPITPEMPVMTRARTTPESCGADSSAHTEEFNREADIKELKKGMLSVPKDELRSNTPSPYASPIQTPELRPMYFPGTPPTPRAEPYIDPRLMLPFTLTPAAVSGDNSSWTMSKSQLNQGTAPYFSGENYSQDIRGQYNANFSGNNFYGQDGTQAQSFQPANFAPSMEYSAPFDTQGYHQPNATPVGSPSAGPSDFGPNPNFQNGYNGWDNGQSFDGPNGNFSPQNGPGYSPNGQGYDGWGEGFDNRPRRSSRRAPRNTRRDPVPPTSGGKVFVGGLGPMTSSATLRQYFAQYGRVVDAAVLTDAEKRSRGFAFVDFEGEIPETVLHGDHVIDQRRCGVRKYAYPSSWAR
jgi:hypothetical protein